MDETIPSTCFPTMWELVLIFILLGNKIEGRVGKMERADFFSSGGGAFESGLSELEFQGSPLITPRIRGIFLAIVLIAVAITSYLCSEYLNRNGDFAYDPVSGMVMWWNAVKWFLLFAIIPTAAGLGSLVIFLRLFNKRFR